MLHHVAYDIVWPCARRAAYRAPARHAGALRLHHHAAVIATSPQTHRSLGARAFALAELGVIAALIAFRANACSAIGFVPIGAATMRLNGGGNDEAGGFGPPATPASQPSAAIQPPASTGTSAASTGDVKTAGDTNQVPDPNCVAKAAADVLTSSPAPAASASCAQISPPPALKSAEQQIQSGSVTASSPPSP